MLIADYPKIDDEFVPKRSIRPRVLSADRGGYNRVTHHYDSRHETRQPDQCEENRSATMIHGIDAECLQTCHSDVILNRPNKQRRRFRLTSNKELKDPNKQLVI